MNAAPEPHLTASGSRGALDSGCRMVDDGAACPTRILRRAPSEMATRGLWAFAIRARSHIRGTIAGGCKRDQAPYLARSSPRLETRPEPSLPIIPDSPSQWASTTIASDAALAVAARLEHPPDRVRPLSLLGKGVNVAQVYHDVAAACQVSPDRIKDVYPCTPMQAGLMFLSQHRHGDYVMQAFMELSPGTHLDRLMHAWKAATRDTASSRSS